MAPVRLSCALAPLLSVAACGSQAAWSSPPQPIPEAAPAAPAAEPHELVERITLGGLEQALLVQGTQSDGPVLLFLHGGPGNSEMTLAHHYGPALEEHFVVVHWDQRGAGRSYSAELQPEQITLELMVSDAVELAEALQTRFSDREIILVGQSWGSLLGVMVAQRRPELFCAYVGVGQLASPQESLQVSHAFALGEAQRTEHQEAIASLAAMDPPSAAHISEVMRWVTFFGGGYGGASDQAPLETIRQASPIPRQPWELTYEDQALSMGALASTIMQADLRRSVTHLELPVWVFAGRSDFVTPGEVAERWLEELAANSKGFVWFANSAHYPHIEETERFLEQLREIGTRCTSPTAG